MNEIVSPDNPIISSWVEAAQKDRREKHPRCHSCGWPHSTVLLCGTGSSFGEAIFGGRSVGVDSSNVQHLLGLRKRLSAMRGFHWKNDIFFEKRDNCIIVSRIEYFNNCPAVHEWSIPKTEWASIVLATMQHATKYSPTKGRT